MKIVKAHNLTCPIDGNRLDQHEKYLSCEKGHAFDIARQGYVNLLPVQHKRSKQPGDSKAMVLARTSFLNTGFYEPVANKLNELILPLIAEDKEACFLDAGCGEGYYFDAVFNFLDKREGSSELSFVGVDISKDAVIQATKRNKEISWVVGTNRNLPVEDESIDIILCLFGFLSIQGFKKALKPDGKIILVDPGNEHLQELRKIIYPEIKKTDDVGSTQSEIPGFSIARTENLQFRTNITNNEQINNLLIMTPHFYRASKEGREIATKLEKLEITIDVIFRVLEKNIPA